MAYPLDLTGADRQLYKQALRNHHRVDTSVLILDRDENPLGQRLTKILDGWVEIDTSTTPTRRLTVTLVDRSNRLAADTSSPSEAALGADRFIRAYYHVRISSTLTKEIPIFTGPITTVERNGAQVTISAVGKESLLLDPYLNWSTQNYGANLEIASAIKQIAQASGETHFRLPDQAEQVLRKKLSIAPFEEPWVLIRRLGRRIGRYAYYDGRGRLTLRPLHKSNIMYEFTGKDVLSDPQVRIDFSNIRNAVVVKGEEVAGEQRRKIIVRHSLSETNPISPQAMARNGVPRYAVVIEDSSFKRRPRLVSRARDLLDQQSDVIYEASFDSLVVPQLEERDACRIDMPNDFGDINYRFVVKQLRIPLVGSAPMTVGNLRRYDSPTWKADVVVKHRKWRRR